MKKLILIQLLALQFFFVIAQDNYNSIKICHSKTQEIKFLSVGEYKVDFENGSLSSFESSDNVVHYYEKDKMFKIETGDTSLVVKLTNAGVKINAKDTSYLITTLTSIGLSPTDSMIETGTVIKLKNYSLACTFKENQIIKMYFVVGERYFSILFKHGLNEINWDFSISRSKSKDVQLLMYAFSYPRLFSLMDERNGVGVRIVCSKKTGIVEKIEGLKVASDGKFYGDRSLKTQNYSKHAILKRSANAFSTNCDN